MVVFGLSGCIRVKWLYSGKNGCFWAKRFCSGSDRIRIKVVLFLQSGCFGARVVVFGQKCLYSVKVVVFGQSGCIQAKVVNFLQRGCFRAKWFIRAKVVVFG